MHGIALRVAPIAALLMLTLAAGCQTAPSRGSGLGNITTVAANGIWHGVVISIRDEHGAEVYSLFKKRRFQSSVDLPPGNFEITHTCSPAQFNYEEMPGQWRFSKWTTKLRLNAGDFIKFVTEGGLTLSGAMCEGKFFVPAGQLIQANRMIP